MLFQNDFGATSETSPATTRRADLHKLLLKRGVNVTVLDEQEGPTNRTYIIRPLDGTRVRDIRKNLEDLSVDLGVDSVQVTYEGGQLKIIVPRADRTFPTAMDLYKETPVEQGEVIVGVGASGTTITAHLKDLPHLLIAGATGAGKSVAMHNWLCGLLTTHSPKNLRLALIDPKRLEFPMYTGLPHLGSKVITEPNEALLLLHELNFIMEERYRTLSRMGLRSAYEEGANLATIVVAIDEFADFRATIGKTFEAEVLRLAQKSRAAGIHLILATQRPSARIVTGDIKANFPARLALKTASAVDSRVILGASGAETLMGKGDAIFMHATGLQRLQVPYAGTEYSNFLKEHYGAAA